MTEPDVVAVSVDERDSAWERDDPTFRVYLQTLGGAGTSANTDTYDVTGADVLQSGRMGACSGRRRAFLCSWRWYTTTPTSSK